MVFKIIIDSREQKLISNFPENETTTASLFLGDVAITDDDDNVILIFERKTLSDLKASVFDGRYKEQKKRLTENFSNRQIMYLIEGFQKFDKLDEILLSSLIHSIFRDNINVLFTKDPADTATAIKAIHNQTQGYPRKINKLCHQLLLNMMSEKEEIVSLNIVENTIGGKVPDGLIDQDQEPVEEPELEVNIDFDEASCEWRRNKRYTGNGTFEYIKKEPYKKPKLDKLEIIHPDEISTDEEDTFHPSPPPAPRRRYVETPRHRYNTRLAAKNNKQKDERLSELLLLGC